MPIKYPNFKKRPTIFISGTALRFYRCINSSKYNIVYRSQSILEYNDRKQKRILSSVTPLNNSVSLSVC